MFPSGCVLNAEALRLLVRIGMAWSKYIFSGPSVYARIVARIVASAFTPSRGSRTSLDGTTRLHEHSFRRSPIWPRVNRGTYTGSLFLRPTDTNFRIVSKLRKMQFG